MSEPSLIRRWARRIKRDVMSVYFAARDPRTPWAVRMLAFAVAAYALSPIDLIPDFIPILGYLDDLLIVPLGLLLVMKFTPEAVLADARARADTLLERPSSRGMAALIILIWVVCLVALFWWLFVWMTPAASGER
jgi:uncharacterized membrane protein YkvA (DUF1232 family)